MDEFCKDTFAPIIKKWLLYNNEINVIQSECTLKVLGHDKKGYINFFENILEMKIEDCDGEIIFYHHFTITDFKSAVDQCNYFIDLLKQDNMIKTRELYKSKSDEKILIVCTSGLSSAFIASEINNYVKNSFIHLEAISCGINDIENFNKYVDIILIAPQISYKLLELQKRFGPKVLSIDSIDFGTKDINGILIGTQKRIK